MMQRVFAWALLASIVWGGYTFASTWKSPWGSVSMPSSPVLSLLPPAGDGCGEKCK